MDGWNHKSVFYDVFWTNAIDLNFNCDASNYSIGAIFLNYWISVAFIDTQKKASIEWRELYVIVIACKTWGHLLTQKLFVIHCDNMSVVEAVNRGSSRAPDVMSLI